ncbi:hypothetical protein CAC42_3630 [Sphaceloma murrayae]|uniref:Uncharacterized protein n=1 Tax=Sphaceloma murrayae TaxID=2082308 RepID=A0A2K1QT19_9PEZI|nr:hypothetical protein CAC42_3630 [Sphaceloma murrayae]
MNIPATLRSFGGGILLWILSIPIFLFTLLPLISSTSAGVSHVYLLSAAWNTESRKDTLLRIGYYGLCWIGGGQSTVCVTTTGASARSIAENHFSEKGRDNTIRGIQFALDLQRSVFVAFMTAGGLAWLVSLILVTLIVLARGNASRSWRYAARLLSSSAAVLMVSSAWATGQAIRAMIIMDEYTAGNERYFTPGTTLIALQWIAALLTCIYAFGVGHVSAAGQNEQVYTYNLGK